MYFQKIGFGFDGTGCGQYAYVPASGDFSYTFCCRPDDPEYSAGSVYYRKIGLLDVRKALADAVLHANITKGHPSSNSLLTACKVNS